MKKYYLLVIISLITHTPLSSDTRGSDSSVTVESYHTFPAGTDNLIEGFGWFRDGFGLQDQTTTCSFKTIFPVSGHISFHGGKIILNNDFILNNKTLWASTGIIEGNKHRFDLASSVTAFPADHTTMFKDARIVLNNDITLSSTIIIQGACAFEGNKNRLVLLDQGTIIIDKEASLACHNIELHGIKNFNIRCLHDSGALILDNSRWVQTSDYSFTLGSIMIQNYNEMAGPYVFAYESSQTSTIDTDSTMYISDFAEFRIGRINPYTSHQPLFFEDASSVLAFEESKMHITSHGVQMLRGTLLGSREFIIEMDSTSTANGLIWGNGQASDDMHIKMLPSSTLIIKSGHLTYNMVNPDNFLSDETYSNFIRYPFTTLYSKQNINFMNMGIAVTASPVTFITDPGLRYTCNNAKFSYPTVTYSLTGTKDMITLNDILDQNNSIKIETGAYPFLIRVNKKQNTLAGSGSIHAPISFTSNLGELSIDFSGKMFSSINLNGGTLFVKNDLAFADDNFIKSSGKVKLSSNALTFGALDLNYNGSISWSGTRGRLQFNSDVYLSSEWSFTGYTILDMNNNKLHLHSSGNISVGSNSTLHIKRAHITGIKNANIRCMLNSSKLILDDVTWHLADNYTFSQGSIIFDNAVDLVGSHTFFYTSANTSTINTNSMLKLADKSSISLGRTKIDAGREALFFQDASSILAIDDASFSITPSGARFTRGTCIIEKQLLVNLSSTSTNNGIVLGSGIPEDDFTIQVNPGAYFVLPNGYLGYQVTHPFGIKSVTTMSKVVTSPQTKIIMQNSFTLKDITIDFRNGLSVISDFDVNYENCTFVAPGIEYNLTGKRLGPLMNELDSGDMIVIKSGTLPLFTTISGMNASIIGFGSIGQQVTVPAATSVNIGIDSLCMAPILLSNGSINIIKNLIFADNKTINGQGIVRLNGNTVELGGLMLKGTGTIDWVGNNGALSLRSNLHLSSRWTFSGSCTIDGRNNRIIFDPTARIAIAPHAKVIFKNIKLDGLLDSQLICLDHSSKIIFDEAIIAQDMSTTFSQGSFCIINELKIEGRDTAFRYQSPIKSIIQSRSELKLKDDVTFSYEPDSDDRTLFELKDSTARIIMNNATLHSTATGLQLTKGYLEVHGQCHLSSEACCQEEGIIFGDYTSESNNLKIDIYPNSNLALINGYLTYRNIG